MTEASETRADVLFDRLLVAVVLTLPLVVLAIAETLIEPGWWLSERSRAVLQLALATPVILWSGWPLHVDAVRQLAAGRPRALAAGWLVIGIGYGYSTAAALGGGRVAGYFAPAAAVVCLLLIDRVVELLRRPRTC